LYGIHNQKNLNSRNLNGDLDAKLALCIPGFSIEIHCPMRKHTIPGLTAEQKQQNHGPCSNTLKTKKIEAALMLFDCIEDLLVFFLTFILSYRNLSNSQIVGRTFKLLMTFQQTLKNEGLKCDPS